MIPQQPQLAEQLVEGEHVDILARIAEDVEAAPLRGFRVISAGDHHAADHVRARLAQRRILAAMRVPVAAHLVLLDQHLVDCAGERSAPIGTPDIGPPDRWPQEPAAEREAYADKPPRLRSPALARKT
jgi:hypothetical protein